MNKPDIKYLKYPLWFRIVFYILTIIIPLIAIMVEGFQSSSTAFKITFGMIVGLLVLWTFISRFLLDNYKHKLKDRQASLEHDYQIDIGNAEKIKWLWFNNEMKLALLEAIQILLIGSLASIVILAISEGLMAIKGVIILIVICYTIAYILKFFLIVYLKGNEYE